LASAALQIEERAVERTRVLLTGTLMTPEGAVQVRVRDISPAGAQIWTERPVRAGCDAVYKRGCLFAAARIVWSEDRHAGLSFYREVPLSEVVR
jgi:PilZ domain